jgi:hypothetical protein
MRFRADEVRFVDEQDSIINQAAAMDSASVPPGYIPIGSIGGSDDFGGNQEFM